MPGPGQQSGPLDRSRPLYDVASNMVSSTLRHRVICQNGLQDVIDDIVRHAESLWKSGWRSVWVRLATSPELTGLAMSCNITIDIAKLLFSHLPTSSPCRASHYFRCHGPSVRRHPKYRVHPLGPQAESSTPRHRLTLTAKTGGEK